MRLKRETGKNTGNWIEESRKKLEKILDTIPM